MTRSSLAASRDTWPASLALVYRRDGVRSTLAERRHVGPLTVQKPLYPEGDAICHTILVHAPGGIAGGDELALDMRIEAGCHVVVTTPAATKWYKANGRAASQENRIRVGDGATLEWLPQEAIVFEEAEARLTTRIDLVESARYAGWEIVCLGRRASGENFRRGSLRQRLEITRNDERLWNEFGLLFADDPLMQSPVGLAGHSVFGGFIVAAGLVPADVVAACRAHAPKDGAGHGVTAVPGIFSARYLGDSVENARDYFQALWGVLRPWYAETPARRPRLWNT